MKKQLKLLVVTLVGCTCYLFISQAYINLFVNNLKPYISWGIGLYYSYILYALLLGISIFSHNFKNKKIVLIISILLFLIFIFYWKSAISYYPYRTLFVLLIGLIIYIVTNFYTLKKI